MKLRPANRMRATLLAAVVFAISIHSSQCAETPENVSAFDLTTTVKYNGTFGVEETAVLKVECKSGSCTLVRTRFLCTDTPDAGIDISIWNSPNELLVTRLAHKFMVKTIRPAKKSSRDDFFETIEFSVNNKTGRFEDFSGTFSGGLPFPTVGPILSITHDLPARAKLNGTTVIFERNKVLGACEKVAVPSLLSFGKAE